MSERSKNILKIILLVLSVVVPIATVGIILGEKFIYIFEYSEYAIDQLLILLIGGVFSAIMLFLSTLVGYININNKKNLLKFFKYQSIILLVSILLPILSGVLAVNVAKYGDFFYMEIWKVCLATSGILILMESIIFMLACAIKKVTVKDPSTIENKKIEKKIIIYVAFLLLFPMILSIVCLFVYRTDEGNIFLGDSFGVFIIGILGCLFYLLGKLIMRKKNKDLAFLIDSSPTYVIKPSTKICEYCGSECGINEKYCSSCGARKFIKK